MLRVACLVLALALSAAALPAEPGRDILGLLTGDADTPPGTSAVVSLHHSPTPSSASGRPTLAQWTPPPASPEPTSVKTAVPSTPSISPAAAESHATDHASRTWQIAGIAIIAVLFVATSIACAMFFDRLWRFLKDVVCCTSHPLASEEFIPDCEKQSWDTRSLSPSPSHCNAESPHEGTIRARELPWNSDTRDWNTLHRQPSRRNDPPATA